MSNKSLALLLVVAIVISLGGTLLSLNKVSQLQFLGIEVVTGRASGIVNLSIEEVAACRIEKNVSFGSGSQGAADLSSDLDNASSEFTENCTLVTDECEGMEINNTGNKYLEVNFSSDKNATTFLGGDNVGVGDFQFKAANGTWDASLSGCNSGLDTSWGNVLASSSGICSNLSYGAANRMITVEYNVTLKVDTPGGDKTATITIDCGQA